jgi:polyhydroxybutyrate depolymerase
MKALLPLLLFFLAGCGQVEGPRLKKSYFSHAGLKRYVLSYTPPGPGPFPLLLVLHGGGSVAEHMPRITGMHRLAELRRFICLFPDSANREWNDGRGGFLKPGTLAHDDSAWLAALAQSYASSGLADPARLYACGLSNGGFMTQRLACEHAGLFAAFGMVAATSPLGYARPGSRPAPICFIHGTLDPIVPYAGGDIHIWRFKKNRGTVLSLDQALAYWVSRNHSGPGTSEELPDLDPQDQTRVRKLFWPAGPGGAPVLAYVVEGGGHSWPGGWKLPEWLCGKTSRDLNASRALADFFNLNP